METIGRPRSIASVSKMFVNITTTKFYILCLQTIVQVHTGAEILVY